MDLRSSLRHTCRNFPQARLEPMRNKPVAEETHWVSEGPNSWFFRGGTGKPQGRSVGADEAEAAAFRERLEVTERFSGVVGVATKKTAEKPPREESATFAVRNTPPLAEERLTEVGE